MQEVDHKFLLIALAEAQKAAECGEVPVGAVLVRDGTIIAQSHNQPILRNDPTAHAELLVIRSAGAAINNYRLNGTTLYVTLEPCAMCAGAIAHARIERLVFAAQDPKGGGVLHGPQIFGQPTCHHKPGIDHGLLADESAALLRSFFRQRRT